MIDLANILGWEQRFVDVAILCVFMAPMIIGLAVKGELFKGW